MENNPDLVYLATYLEHFVHGASSFKAGHELLRLVTQGLVEQQNAIALIKDIDRLSEAGQHILLGAPSEQVLLDAADIDLPFEEFQSKWDRYQDKKLVEKSVDERRAIIKDPRLPRLLKKVGPFTRNEIRILLIHGLDRDEIQFIATTTSYEDWQRYKFLRVIGLADGVEVIHEALKLLKEGLDTGDLP
jgi:hypothetical protein